METIEEFNGYKNRETWAMSNLLDNNETLYENLYDIANGYLETIYQKGRALEEYYTELLMEGFITIETQREIGSLWRVDWEEIVETAIVETAIED